VAFHDLQLVAGMLRRVRPYRRPGAPEMSDARNAFVCAECGSKEIQFPDNPQPDDMVICMGCGASNRYDEIQKIAAKLEQDAVTDIVRDALKNIKGLKFE
jgi:hypothetical protein